jgi:hypothetical protein
MVHTIAEVAICRHRSDQLFSFDDYVGDLEALMPAAKIERFALFSLAHVHAALVGAAPRTSYSRMEGLPKRCLK